MKKGSRVSTPSGDGTIVSKEVFNDRFCVKLDHCPERLEQMQEKQGGLYFWKGEIKEFDR